MSETGYNNAAAPHQSGLIIFAKAPRPGYVKTRLIPRLGAERAAQLHWALVTHLIAGLARQAPASFSFELHSDNPEHPALQTLVDRYALTVHQQCEGDLGQRMTYAMQQGFARYQRVAICGCDSVDLNYAVFAKLFTALDSAYLAIQPANDGGYLALAASELRAAKTVMSNIDWGTERVLTQTLARAKQGGLTAWTANACDDIDEPEDLELPAVRAFLEEQGLK